ncbi:hypothetical protein [Flavobacterium sp.]|uniref:hypothetical protein n=1 Tax=Flavobacterium sp. TaxID=239 RepID=UPI0022BBF1D6|nr:hypothetical protein [Flavobacterium sp.]MCZ8229263.1 hypothetical protein [Flavobacterium sp.]
MDLQTRKLNFIQYFLKLESEKTIAQFEKLLRNTAVNEEEHTIVNAIVTIVLLRAFQNK